MMIQDRARAHGGSCSLDGAGLRDGSTEMVRSTAICSRDGGVVSEHGKGQSGLCGEGEGIDTVRMRRGRGEARVCRFVKDLKWFDLDGGAGVAVG
ncbi:hypothetical protein M0R45_030920 [Rubus argutus]